MGYFTELAKAIVNFIQEVNKIKEKYSEIKQKKSKKDILNALKKLERELYPEHQWTINDCDDWEEFCEYACDDAEKEPIIFYDNEYYLIINVDEKDKAIEIVDCATKNPDKIWAIFQNIKKVYNDFEVDFVYCDVMEKAMKMIKKLYCEGKIDLEYLEKIYDYDFKEYVWKIHFTINN